MGSARHSCLEGFIFKYPLMIRSSRKENQVGYLGKDGNLQGKVIFLSKIVICHSKIWKWFGDRKLTKHINQQTRSAVLMASISSMFSFHPESILDFSRISIYPFENCRPLFKWIFFPLGIFV